MDIGKEDNNEYLKNYEDFWKGTVYESQFVAEKQAEEKKLIKETPKIETNIKEVDQKKNVSEKTTEKDTKTSKEINTKKKKDPIALLKEEKKKREQLANVLNRITGEFRKEEEYGDDLSAVMVVGCVLTVFRYLTVDQFRILLPGFDKYRLPNIVNWAKKQKKGWFKAGNYDNGKAYYYLTDEGLTYFRQYFTKDFLHSAHVPVNTGGAAPRTKGDHDIVLRNVPYGCIASGGFKYFRWYTSVSFAYQKDDSIPLTEVIQQNVNSDANFKKKEESYTKKIIVDGILHFRKGNYTILVEQDTGTERIGIIAQKMNNYAEYFLGQYESEKSAQILFNVSMPYDKAPAKKTNTQPLKNIKVVMKLCGSETIKELYTKLDELKSQDPDSARMYGNMESLIQEYEKAGNSLEKGVTALTDYVNKQNLANDKGPGNTSTSASVGRCNAIKKMLWEWLTGSDTYKTKSGNTGHIYNNTGTWLSGSVEHGLSIVITDNFVQYAVFLEPRISNTPERIKTALIKGGYDSVAINDGAVTLSNNYYSACFRNSIRTKRAILIIEEITCDIGARYRVYDALKKRVRTKDGTKVVYLLLVSGEEDAFNFVSKSEWLQEYCAEIKNGVKKDRYTEVRFMKYSEGEKCQGSYIPIDNKLVYYSINEFL